MGNVVYTHYFAMIGVPVLVTAAFGLLAAETLTLPAVAEAGDLGTPFSAGFDTGTGPVGTFGVFVRGFDTGPVGYLGVVDRGFDTGAGPVGYLGVVDTGFETGTGPVGSLGVVDRGFDTGTGPVGTLGMFVRGFAPGRALGKAADAAATGLGFEAAEMVVFFTPCTAPAYEGDALGLTPFTGRAFCAGDAGRAFLTDAAGRAFWPTGAGRAF